MNSAQFYYIHKVLGLTSFIQPKNIRKAYRIHRSSYQQTQFLFFCSHLDTEEKKLLMQKIAQSLGYTNTMIISISDAHHPHIPLLLNNFLTRFMPKGFIIFGYDLASFLIPLNPKYIQNKKILWNKKISGCVLNPLSDFTDSDTSLVQTHKQQAWNLLKQSFFNV